jgi:SMC interacting uncharacterized protein involved in chromosome segregation
MIYKFEEEYAIINSITDSTENLRSNIELMERNVNTALKVSGVDSKLLRMQKKLHDISINLNEVQDSIVSLRSTVDNAVFENVIDCDVIGFGYKYNR